MVSGAAQEGTSGTSSLDQYFFGTPPPPTAFGDVVISPNSQTAYLTVPSENEVAVLNLQTGIFGAPIDVGSGHRGSTSPRTVQRSMYATREDRRSPSSISPLTK